MPTTPFFIGSKGNYPGLTFILLVLTGLLSLAVIYLLCQHHYHRHKARQRERHQSHHHGPHSGDPDDHDRI